MCYIFFTYFLNVLRLIFAIVTFAIVACNSEIFNGITSPVLKENAIFKSRYTGLLFW